MGTNNTCNNNVAFHNSNDEHNVSSTVHNKYIMIFRQKKVAVINPDWYFDLPEGFLWPRIIIKFTYITKLITKFLLNVLGNPYL